MMHKKLIKSLLSLVGFEIFPITGNPDPVRLLVKGRIFARLMKEVKGYTLLTPASCFMLYKLARSVDDLPGEVAEVGVYRGGQPNF